MSHRTLSAFLLIALLSSCKEVVVDGPTTPRMVVGTTPITAATGPTTTTPRERIPDPIPTFVVKGVDWLVAAQHENGGWGGGSHASQQVRDPHAVTVDPGTTAFAALALLRTGSTPTSGPHRETVAKATEYLLGVVESAKDEGPFITDIRGTQPQAKMGQQVDTALCSQFLTRLLTEVDGTDLEPRVAKAVDKCLKKIQDSQGEDGSWGQGGWAPVLQSSLMANALEQGAVVDRSVSEEALNRAQDYQQRLVGRSGELDAGAAAGVKLYASASNMRGNVASAKRAEKLVDDAKRDGRVDKDAKISAETLRRAGLDKNEAEKLGKAFAMNEAAKTRSFDESLLSGFGNNGGEEFLSYMMKSESLVIDGGATWDKWYSKMSERLAKVQNQDGSWSGHHCITSPVFCTAAAISCITADRDAAILRKASEQRDR